MTTRETYRLTPAERTALDNLWPSSGFATGEGGGFGFWRAVAKRRGLDYSTILGNPYDRSKFTALPLGHGEHWCWPSPLKCAKPPADFSAVNPQFGFGAPA
jgi:hypothetical protein